jgi:hypothetical protein
LRRAERRAGVGGTEDQVRLAVDVELLRQGRRHVDLAQHPKSPAGEFLADPGHRLGEAERSGGAQVRGAGQRLAGSGVAVKRDHARAIMLAGSDRCAAAGPFSPSTRYHVAAPADSLLVSLLAGSRGCGQAPWAESDGRLGHHVTSAPIATSLRSPRSDSRMCAGSVPDSLNRAGSKGASIARRSYAVPRADGDLPPVQQTVGGERAKHAA